MIDEVVLERISLQISELLILDVIILMVLDDGELLSPVFGSSH